MVLCDTENIHRKPGKMYHSTSQDKENEFECNECIVWFPFSLHFYGCIELSEFVNDFSHRLGLSVSSEAERQKYVEILSKSKIKNDKTNALFIHRHSPRWTETERKRTNNGENYKLTSINQCKFYF